MHTPPMHPTPIFITEALCLITYIQLTANAKVTAYTALAYSY